jgi:hypothetical protein
MRRRSMWDERGAAIFTSSRFDHAGRAAETFPMRRAHAVTRRLGTSAKHARRKPLLGLSDHVPLNSTPVS